MISIQNMADKTDNNAVNDKQLDLEAFLNLDFAPSWAKSSEKGESENKIQIIEEEKKKQPKIKESKQTRSVAGLKQVVKLQAQPLKPPPQKLPHFEVKFVPEQSNLKFSVRFIKSVKKALPLRALAKRALANSQAHRVKLLAKDSGNFKFVQCKLCGCASTAESIMHQHMFTRHFIDFFDSNVVEVDPPTGEFKCVIRCKLSGELLGPPNHHSYFEKMQILHRLRFPYMSIAEYQQHLESIYDPAVIEEWRNQARKKVSYILKTAEEKDRREMSWIDAEIYFMDKIIPLNITTVDEVSIPGKVVSCIEDKVLRHIIAVAYNRERQWPKSILFGLRAAYRRMGLYVVYIPKAGYIVTAIEPRPLDLDRSAPEIKKLLEFIYNHPQITRKGLIERLYPDGKDAPEVTQILSIVSWLVEKGHIIELADGRLVVPVQAGPAEEAPDSSVCDEGGEGNIIW